MSADAIDAVEDSKDSPDTVREFLMQLVLDINWTPVVLGGIVVFAVAAATGTIPSFGVSDEHITDLAQVMAAAAMAYYPARWLVSKMHSRTVHLLFVVHPDDGDAGLAFLGSERWKELTVVDRDGDEIERGELHHITTLSGMSAWECHRYDRDTNTAVVSWMGGYKPDDIRSFRGVVDRLMEMYGEMADRYRDLKANFTLLVEDEVNRQVNEFIHRYEGLKVPDDGETPLERVERKREKYGLAEDDIEESLNVADPRVEHGSREDPDVKQRDITYSHYDESVADDGGEDL